MTKFRVVAWITLITLLSSPLGLAQTGIPALSPVSPAASAKQELDIPKKPSAPPTFNQRDPGHSFQCERQYLHEGKLYPCDSYLSPDAERLRPLLNTVPAALQELEIYQGNRHKARTAAYWATFGFALALTGLLVSNFYKATNGELDSTGELIRSLGLIGGGGLGAGSLLYGFLLIKSNESHLDQALKIYNSAHPESPIQIQVNVGIQF